MGICGQRAPGWTGPFLRLAGFYSLGAAVLAAAWPEWFDTRLGAAQAAAPLLRESWHAIAVLTAVMGLGYLLAARDAYRHWPIALMGLLAKLATGAWISFDIVSGRTPPALWSWVIVDCLLWIAPLLAILRGAYEALLAVRRTVSPDILRLALRRKTNLGLTIEELTRLTPVLLVFLRHTGCTFCREALADLSLRRAAIEGEGARLVLVHMGSEEHGVAFFARYGLEDIQRVGDPDRALYRAFGLPRGHFMDLFGPKVWWRGFQAGLLGGHGIGRLAGDGFQMPGVFLLFHGEIVRSYRHQSAADRPDYVALVTGRGYAAPEFSAR